MSVTKCELINEVENFIIKISYIDSYFRVWNELRMSFPKFHAARNVALPFFQTVEHGLLRLIFLETYKLFDRDSESKSIKKLISNCRTNNKLLRTESINKKDILQLLQGYEDTLNQLSDKINNLRGHRDNYLAHIDGKYFSKLNQLKTDYPVSMSDVQDLYYFALDVCCNIYFILTENEIKWENQDEVNCAVSELFVTLEKGLDVNSCDIE